jgi:hypothetical protein
MLPRIVIEISCLETMSLIAAFSGRRGSHVFALWLTGAFLVLILFQLAHQLRHAEGGTMLIDILQGNSFSGFLQTHHTLPAREGAISTTRIEPPENHCSLQPGSISVVASPGRLANLLRKAESYVFYMAMTRFIDVHRERHYHFGSVILSSIDELSGTDIFS